MLKVDADDLKPIAWTDSKASKVGHWVASAGTGQDPVAIGVLSVAAREVKGAKFIASVGHARAATSAWHSTSILPASRCRRC